MRRALRPSPRRSGKRESAIPGFAQTEYDIVGLPLGENGEVDYRIIRKYTGSVNNPDVQLSFAQKKYEMFAFGASSIVAPLGGVNSMAGLGGVFSSGQNLAALSNRFNNLNTGHSGQFIHSFSQVRGYWDQLLRDITPPPGG